MGVLFQFKPLHRAVLLVGMAGVVMALLGWLSTRNPRIAFLPGDGRAGWILFPSAPFAGMHRVADLSVVFRRQFVLDGRPQTAALSVRAAKRFQLRLNAMPISVCPGANWKDISSADVLAGLHTGTNTIEVRVFNDNAPPALWLVLVTDQTVLRSDRAWEATTVDSAWRQVALAAVSRRPGRGNPMAEGETTPAAVAAVWPFWLILSGLAAALWGVGWWWLQGIPMSNASAARRWRSRETVIPLAIIALLWMAMFWNNSRWVPHIASFDEQGHAGYIDYIQKHQSLPLPNEGWEMFQPPLYYGISAAVLSSFGLSVTDEAAGAVLRSLTMFFGLANLALVFLSLRLLFPGQTGRQWVGLILAAFLPMLLYLSHYVTNETLVALLISASIYLCLRILKLKTDSWTGFILLGLILGAALLAKFTAVLAVPFIVGALAKHLLARRDPAGRGWMKFGGMLGMMILISGWHYVRLWWRMGRVVIGGWDQATGSAWWQDDGYHAAAYFEHFGESLIHPLFGCTASFWDGIYSTLWGDGLCGGATSLVSRPPWNYNLTRAGYLLAVLPTLFVLVGAAAAAARFFRRDENDWFVLLGLAFAVCAGLIYLNLTVPCYASVKSFYGLCALIPFCAFGAAGWGVLTRGRKSLQFVLGVLLLVWAMNSFASVWIRGNSAAARVYIGTELGLEGRTEAALAEFAKAVKLDPSDASARLCLASGLSRLDRTEEAMQQAGQAVALNPADDAGHYTLGMILARQGRMEQAIAEARRAVELGPEDLPAYRLLSDCLLKTGRDEEAIPVLRNGLAIFPYDASLHLSLGLAAAQKGALTIASNHFEYALVFDPDSAAAHLNYGQFVLLLGDVPNGLRHLRQAVHLAPDSPEALDRLAWLLATCSNAAARNGPEALPLAERACALTRRGNPAMLGTLAAAYAEAGKFPQAVNTVQEALALARTTGNEAVAGRTENLLGCFQSGRPFHENPFSSP